MARQIERDERLESRRRRERVVDWLGACKPLDLICGACALIATVAALVRAI